MTTATGPLADPTSDGSTQRRIDYLPLDDIAPAARNPKEHARDEIVRSVRTFGFTSPVLYDERTERLVVGHGRLDALRALREEAGQGDPPPDGIRTDSQGGWLVPVVRGWASESDAHAEAYLVADNRLTEVGGWDDHALAAILEDAREHSDALLASTGYTAEDLDDLLFKVSPRQSLDSLADEYGEPDHKDLWPKITVAVPPATRAAFLDLMDRVDGAEHEKFAAIIDTARDALGITAPAPDAEPGDTDAA